MNSYLTFYNSFNSNPNSTSATSFTSTTEYPSRRSVTYLIAKILRVILPKTWFCWVSRGTVQLQSILSHKRWSYWTKLNDHVYVGAIPLKNWNHLDEITALGVKTILSMNEDYEFQKHRWSDPVKPVDWKEKKINFLNLSSPDLEPIGISRLAAAVDYVAAQVKLGNPVYIHCTAGRGRSVSVAICSLIKINRWALQQSIKHVTQCRPQCMLSPKQIQSITTWYEAELQTCKS